MAAARPLCAPILCTTAILLAPDSPLSPSGWSARFDASGSSGLERADPLREEGLEKGNQAGT